MTKGDIVYRQGIGNPGDRVGAWDGAECMPLVGATRHKDRKGWTLVLRDSSGARIVGVQRGDNDIVRVRSVTSREVS